MNTSFSRIFWLDDLRVLACILVIASHITGQFFVAPPFVPENTIFLYSSFYTVFVRVSIPLFFMISGALLLPVEGPIGKFLKKRFSRVLIPFLLWSLLYTIFPWCYETFTGGSFKMLFPLSRASSDFSAMAENILLIPFKFNVGVHLWYLYVLIGLYLFAPIISPWVEKAGKKEFLYFLTLWGITLFFPYIRLVWSDFFGTCSWNEYGTLHSFSGYLGYMVLGYFLRKYCSGRSFTRTLLWAAPCLVAGFCFTLHFYRVSTMAAQASSGTWIGFASINVAVMAVALFSLFQSFPRSSSTGWGRGFLTEFSRLSFGIYLVHFFLVGGVCGFFKNMGWLEIPVFISLPLLVFITSLLSFLVIKMLSFLPGGRYLIG